jgi:Uma2 family endonuclease
MKRPFEVETHPRMPIEAFKMLPEGTLAELIDNQIYMSPAPVPIHQIVLNDINVQLYQFLKETNIGMVYISPLDVYLDETSNAVQPDIIVLLKDNFQLLKDGHIQGTPDMLVEILSKGNKDHDLIRKRAIYQRFGVKEYWIIDPETKRAIGFQFTSKGYERIAEDTGVIRSQLLNTSFTF